MNLPEGVRRLARAALAVAAAMGPMACSGGGGVAITGGESPVLFTDLTYCPKVAGQDCFVTLVGLDLPNPATVLVGGKPQTVLAQGVLDGTGWKPMLHKHAGLVQDGLTDSATGFYDYIEVRLSNVAAGDSGITLDGIAGTAPFTVGSSGSIYFADPDSGNDANAGTIGAPWLHIQPFQNKACGSILYLRGSTTEYTKGGNSFGFYTPSPSCTASAPMAVVGYPGEHAILNTNGTRAYYTDTEKNYQDMAKLDVNGHGTGTQALYPPGDGHHFTLMTFHDIHSGNTGSVFELKGCSSHFWYQGNYAYNTGQGTSNQSHASYFGGYEGVSCGYTSGDLHANYNEYSGHDGGYIQGAYSHLADDHITDLDMSWNYFHDKTANQPGHQVIVIGNGDGKRDWIDSATVRGNTVDLGGINNAAIYFANDAVVAQVHNNVVFGWAGGTEWEFGNINGGNTWPAVAPGSSATGNCGERPFSIGSLTAPNLFTSDNGSDYPDCLAVPVPKPTVEFGL